MTRHVVPHVHQQRQASQCQAVTVLPISLHMLKCRARHKISCLLLEVDRSTTHLDRLEDDQEDPRRCLCRGTLQQVGDLSCYV